MKNFDYIIIGNSHAAIGCIEGIRSQDKIGSCAVISDEKHHCYSRPLISYLLEGKTDIERMKYRPDDFYKKNNITKFLGKYVSEIDPENKTVTLGEEKLGYGKLMTATGSSPFVPSTAGYDSVKKKFTFMDLDSALALEKVLTPESKVLIVGAGLIGLKCAEGIYGRCAEITVVDLAPRILSSILDDDGSSIVRRHIEEKEIKFHLGTSVSEFKKNRAILADGTVIDFDILVMAVGVRANTALLVNAGARANRGIITNERQETSPIYMPQATALKVMIYRAVCAEYLPSFRTHIHRVIRPVSTWQAVRQYLIRLSR